jgi:hypothetical protein
VQTKGEIMKYILLFLILFLSYSISAQETIRKEISYDFSVTEDGTIQPRRITKIIDGDKEIGRSYNRLNGAIDPGSKILDELPQNIKNAIKEVWTPKVIKDFEDKKALLDHKEP